MYDLIETVDTEITASTEPALDLTETLLAIRSHSSLENDLVESWIAAATTYFEEQTGHQLTTATREYWLDTCPYPARKIELPRPPLQSVVSVSYLDADGVLQTFDDGGSPLVNYWSSKAPAGIPARRGWIELIESASWPVTQAVSGAVRIRYTCGYGDAASDVPHLARAVLRHLVADFDKFRSQTVTGTIVQNIPIGVDQILKAFKYSSLPSILPRRIGWL